ncbi:MAG: hypothetical protein ACI94Y_002171 [Maribacter sp.]|jgi:hypothetical protein
MTELMDKYPKMDESFSAKILRDKGGMNNIDIGLGNEKSINQLIAHHAIIFKPKERIVWVSVPPYMLGGFVAYDLDKIFNQYKGLKNLLKSQKIVWNSLLILFYTVRNSYITRNLE